MSRSESFARWQALKQDLMEATEEEKAEVLGKAQVGKSGIQYRQRQRKEAERREKTFDFAQKIILRERYALEHGKTGWKRR
jgi:hypothetical protein